MAEILDGGYAAPPRQFGLVSLTPCNTLFQTLATCVAPRSSKMEISPDCFVDKTHGGNLILRLSALAPRGVQTTDELTF